jgi:hypothetical protein
MWNVISCSGTDLSKSFLKPVQSPILVRLQRVCQEYDQWSSLGRTVAGRSLPPVRTGDMVEAARTGVGLNVIDDPMRSGWCGF